MTAPPVRPLAADIYDRWEAMARALGGVRRCLECEGGTNRPVCAIGFAKALDFGTARPDEATLLLVGPRPAMLAVGDAFDVDGPPDPDTGVWGWRKIARANDVAVHEWQYRVGARDGDRMPWDDYVAALGIVRDPPTNVELAIDQVIASAIAAPGLTP